MKLPAVAVCLLAVGSILLFGDCGYGSSSSGSTTPTITVTPQLPGGVPVNATVTFTSVVSSGSVNNPTWTVLDSAYGNAGSPTTQAGGTTFTYTAPPSPPIYSGTLAQDLPGYVTIQAFNGSGNVAYAHFPITTPAIAVTLMPSAATVALGATQNFQGYAVGGANNTVLAQVNGVTGGSSTLGTFVYNAYGVNYGTNTYTYTAPASMPASGNTVTLALVSQADPTKSASATVTLH